MRPPRRGFLALGAAALMACVTRREGQTASEPSGIDRERVRRRVPGIAIALVRRGAPDAIEAHGDLTADTPTEVASLSKPVFAYAVIAESARGAIDLDAPIVAIAPPPYAHRRRGAVDRFDDARLADVTPRHLLSHRAGLPNWSRDRPLAFVDPPGGRWRYSGEGYVLLQRAIESSHAEPLDAFMQRSVFAPLAMRRSSYDPRRIAPRAQGHDRAGAPLDSSLGSEEAATSLVSTAADYARFARRIVEAPAGDPIVEAMLAREAEVDADRRLAWGLGFALAAPEWFFHWGVSPGFRTLLVGSRSRGEALLVLTSSDAGMELGADVVRARFGDLPLLSFPMLYPDD
jgi:CubicO group peptidase (beta-lactamase class C family)